MTSLLDQIIVAAKTEGIAQKELASLIGIDAAVLSRGKKRGSISSSTIEKAAKAANLTIRVYPNPKVGLKPASSAWSAPGHQLSKSLLPARLTNASFLDLVELCVTHTPELVSETLEAVKAELKPAQYKIERAMLDNIQKGLRNAC